jgi:homoserine O-succinyltransferase/O-acetyltransferase
VKPLVVCIVDMNNGHVNQAIRCFRRIVDGFFERVHAKNPGLRCERIEVSPRDTNDPIPRHADLYLSSGGPVPPSTAITRPWSHDYAAFLDGIVASRSASAEDHRSLFGVCYSYEMIVRHFQLGHLVRRNGRKFGVMPIYTTREGQAHPLFAPFGDRLFAFEHRNWEVVDLDLSRVEALGGQLLAQESRDGFSKGRAVLGLDVTAGIRSGPVPPGGRPRRGVELDQPTRAGLGVPVDLR